MRLLIVASSAQELQGLFKLNPDGTDYLDRVLPCGNGEVVGMSVGVGLVQAALGTYAAITKWWPDHVVVFGTGGAVRSDLELGDLVTADQVLQYSLDLRAFGLQRGESFGPNAGSVNGAVRLMLCLPPLEGVRTINGIIGSADMFAVRSWREANPWLSDELHVDLTDMESYAMVRACRQCLIPCCVARVVSDTADGHRPKHYGRFMSETVAGILEKIIEAVKVKL